MTSLEWDRRELKIIYFLIIMQDVGTFTYTVLHFTCRYEFKQNFKSNKKADQLDAFTFLIEIQTESGYTQNYFCLELY